MLTPEELERYARHIVLREVGGPGQAALKRARVLVVGAGGLGAPVLLYLAAAGVGTLGVIDDDMVSLSNLQRQVIHGTPDIGAPKVDSAAVTIRRLNPHVAAARHGTRLRRGWRPGRARRRARFACRARSDPRDRRLRRRPGRAPADGRCPLAALRDPALWLGSRQPAVGRAADDHRSIHPQ